MLIQLYISIIKLFWKVKIGMNLLVNKY